MWTLAQKNIGGVIGGRKFWIPYRTPQNWRPQVAKHRISEPALGGAKILLAIYNCIILCIALTYKVRRWTTKIPAMSCQNSANVVWGPIENEWSSRASQTACCDFHDQSRGGCNFKTEVQKFKLCLTSLVAVPLAGSATMPDESRRLGSCNPSGRW